MTARCLALSVVLHGAVLFCGPKRHTPQARPIAVEVTIIAPKALKLRPLPQAPRLGSEAYKHQYRKLGHTAAAQHYLDRLHAHIDPHWHALVDRANMVRTCSTVLHIDGNASGTVLSVLVVQNTCPPRLRQCAVDAVWQSGLIPPPKIFLDKAGVLKLEWTFNLKPKE